VLSGFIVEGGMRAEVWVEVRVGCVFNASRNDPDPLSFTARPFVDRRITIHPILADGFLNKMQRNENGVTLRDSSWCRS
jgi:hypothetical protein